MYAKYIETIIHNAYLILFYFLVSVRVMRTFAPGGIPEPGILVLLMVTSGNPVFSSLNIPDIENILPDNLEDS